MQYYVTKCELEIMNVLWCAGAPLSRSGILEQSKDKSWKDNSIHILLNGMLKKGLIKETGFIRSGKVWARLYSPALTVEEYYIDQMSTGRLPSFAVIIQALYTSGKLSTMDLASIQEVLDGLR